MPMHNGSEINSGYLQMHNATGFVNGCNCAGEQQKKGRIMLLCTGSVTDYCSFKQTADSPHNNVNSLKRIEAHDFHWFPTSLQLEPVHLGISKALQFGVNCLRLLHLQTSGHSAFHAPNPQGAGLSTKVWITQPTTARQILVEDILK